MGVDEALGDFPINFSIILDLKVDLVGVVDPAEAAIGAVLVFGVIASDEDAKIASLLPEATGFLSKNPKANLRRSFGVVCCELCKSSVDTGVELRRPKAIPSGSGPEVHKNILIFKKIRTMFLKHQFRRDCFTYYWLGLLT